MNTAKKIAWKSWNAIEELLVFGEEHNESDMETEEFDDAQGVEMSLPFFPIIESQPRLIHTPVGLYPADSMFKPSDRWDCWIAMTNFGVTKSIDKILKKDIEGIEALKVIGRYTFFIGIAPLFEFKDIRIEIENKLCDYTEQEVLSDEETQATVDLVKKQLTNSKYWSILVAPSGKIDYVVSDRLDETYLDGLNELLELKQDLGGIILRGDHG